MTQPSSQTAAVHLAYREAFGETARPAPAVSARLALAATCGLIIGQMLSAPSQGQCRRPGPAGVTLAGWRLLRQ